MTTEQKLREALDKLLNFDRLGLHGYIDAVEHARQVLQETAPEPPKHPAEVGWHKYWLECKGDCGPQRREAYLRAFKDALEWADTFEGSPAILAAAKTVPL